MEDRAEIRRLHRAEGMSIKALARRLGPSRNTVRAALRSDGPPRYERRPMPSVLDAVEPDIRRLLHDTPDMPAVKAGQPAVGSGVGCSRCGAR